MTELFHQIYNPVGGSVLFSALVAAVPPLLLALLLAVLRVARPQASQLLMRALSGSAFTRRFHSFKLNRSCDLLNHGAASLVESIPQ